MARKSKAQKAKDLAALFHKLNRYLLIIVGILLMWYFRGNILASMIGVIVLLFGIVLIAAHSLREEIYSS